MGRGKWDGSCRIVRANAFKSVKVRIFRRRGEADDHGIPEFERTVL